MTGRAWLEHASVSPLPPQRFKEVLSEGQSTELDDTIERGQRQLAGRVVWNVNTTMRGGGVAEMLTSLIAYARGAGVDSRWVVVGADPGFFEVTKRIHNMLHGSPGDGRPLDGDAEEVYRQVSAAAAGELADLVRPGDIVVLHDPQTAGLVEPSLEVGAHVVWRCHVGIDLPNDLARSAWRFLLPHVTPADAYIFSRRAFAWEGLDASRVTIIPPSIDAFSAKNQAMDAATVTAVLRTAGIEDGPAAGVAGFTHQDGTPARVDRKATLNGTPMLPPGTPALVQVSRWDRLKDHGGVLRAFVERVAPQTDAHLVLAGPDPAAVSDDPEGTAVFKELLAAWRASAPEVRPRVHLASLPMEDPEENAAIVNALQRRAAVVAQKSLAEGFGLTVAEAMWKGRPVVASDVGGIRDQIVDGGSGVLVEPNDAGGFAGAVTDLLTDPQHADRLGQGAREQVRDLFLGPRHLRQYVDLFEALLR